MSRRRLIRNGDQAGGMTEDDGCGGDAGLIQPQNQTSPPHHRGHVAWPPNAEGPDIFAATPATSGV